MFPLKKGPQAASDAGGMDRDAQLKDEILAELIETLEAGLSKELPKKKGADEGLEIDILAADPAIGLEDEEEDEDFG